jgi:hypothetical protein
MSDEIHIGDPVYICDIPQEKVPKLSLVKRLVKRLYHHLFPTPIHILQDGDQFWLLCTYRNGKIYSMMNKKLGEEQDE